MSLIHLVKFRKMETGLYKIVVKVKFPFKMRVFKMGFTVVVGKSIQKHFAESKYVANGSCHIYFSGDKNASPDPPGPRDTRGASGEEGHLKSWSMKKCY